MNDSFKVEYVVPVMINGQIVKFVKEFPFGGNSPEWDKNDVTEKSVKIIDPKT